MKKALSVIVIAATILLGVPSIFFALLGVEGKEGFGLAEGLFLFGAVNVLVVACRAIVGKLTPGWPHFMFKE